jgi:hypothetical protein
MKELITIIDQMLKRLKKREGKRCECEPRSTYSDWLIIKLWLICVLESWTINVFYAKLRRECHAWRRRYNLPTRMPSRSTVYARLRQRSIRYRLREFFHESTRYALRLSSTEETEILAIDLTALEAAANDIDAAWGYRGRNDMFWGYKLGLVVTRSGIPLELRLISGNRVESHVSQPLLIESNRRLHETRKQCSYVTCDKGFDAEKNYRTTAKRLHAILVCPGRRRRKQQVEHPYHRNYFARTKYPYRTPACAFAHTAEGRTIYRQRTVVEQVNGQLKDSFGLQRIPRAVRGYQRMYRWCLGKLIFYGLALIANRVKGEYNRQLKALAA